MKDLRFAIFGTGFWSRFQLAGWGECPSVQCVALYNRTRSKAEALAREFGVPAIYDDPEELLGRENLDFVDIITDVDTHSKFVHLAAQRKVAVICQKPMAPSLEIAEQMVEVCRQAGVPYAVHENWRWQTPLRNLKRVLDTMPVGKLFRARIHYCWSFPVFENQPFLKELEQFILTDIGSHILDTARMLFGEASSLLCTTYRAHHDIKGEDVATVMMTMGGDTTVVCEMSYATISENERFPQTYVSVEGEEGSVELGPDYWIRVTAAKGTEAKCYPPPHYSWADRAYDIAHSSIVDCNRDLLRALQTGQPAETSGDDNLKTVRLVFGAYESARAGRVVEP